VKRRYGFGDNYSLRDLNIVAGTTWDRGFVYAAAAHADQSTIENTSRPF
jgi:hypothetical protein